MGQHSVKRKSSRGASHGAAQGSARSSSGVPVGCVVFIVLAAIAAAALLVIFLVVPMFEQAPYEQPSRSSVAQEEQSGSETALSPKMRSVKSAVDKLVSSYGDDVAVCVLPVDGSAGYSINGDERFIAGSMIKLAILATYLEQADRGDFDRYSTYLLQVEDIVGGAGVIQNSSPGAAYTYEQLAKYMIVNSDNAATNILINTLGMDAINERIEELGLEGTELNRKMMVNNGLDNYVTADDCAAVLFQIARGTLTSLESCSLAESYLLAQEFDEGLSQGIPDNVGFGHKTGSLVNVTHDGGIVYTKVPYVIVVLTNLPETEANDLMAKISKAVYDIMK